MGAILDAVGSEEERADTLVGLLFASFQRGISGRDLIDLLDECWLRIEPIRFLEQGACIADHDTNQIASSFSGTEAAHPIPLAVLQHLWDWAIEHQRPDVTQLLLSLNLSPGAWVLRQSLLEALMARLLIERRSISGQSPRPVGQ